MLLPEVPVKVAVDVIEKNKQYFATVDFNYSCHSLGPAKSRDEIYQLIFNLIQDLRLIAEIENKRKYQAGL